MMQLLHLLSRHTNPSILNIASILSHDTNRLINADEIKCHYLPALFTINLMHSTAAILLQSLFSTLLTISINAHFQYSDTINEHYLVNANHLETQEIDMLLRQAGLPLELANLMTTTNFLFSTNQCSLRSSTIIFDWSCTSLRTTYNITFRIPKTNQPITTLRIGALTTAIHHKIRYYEKLASHLSSPHRTTTTKFPFFVRSDWTFTSQLRFVSLRSHGLAQSNLPRPLPLINIIIFSFLSLALAGIRVTAKILVFVMCGC